MVKVILDVSISGIFLFVQHNTNTITDFYEEGGWQARLLGPGRARARRLGDEPRVPGRIGCAASGEQEERG